MEKLRTVAEPGCAKSREIGERAVGRLLGAESVVGGQRYLASSLRGHEDAVCVRREVHHHAEVVVRPRTVRDGYVGAVTGAVAHINGIGAVEADDGSKVGPGGCVCGSEANGDICSPAWLAVASKFAVKLVVCVGNATFDQEVVWATRFIAGAVKLRFKVDEAALVLPAASASFAMKL